MKTALANRIRLRGIALAVAALAGTALVASLALAHNRVFPNSVTLTRAAPINPGGVAAVYRGRVLSNRANCKRNREVQVWRADVNPEVRLFTTRTRNSAGGLGYWLRKNPALPNGAKVYALIETKVLPPFTAAHDHTCPVDRSPVRTVPYP
jgi:hypothetical protein